LTQTVEMTGRKH